MEDSVEYTSDDEVCFGQYTIEEAKRDVKKYVYRPISRRHSSPYNVQQQKCLMDSEKEEPASDVTTTSTEYLTAESSMKTACSQHSRTSPSSFYTIPERPNSEATNNMDSGSFYEFANKYDTCYLSKISQALVENTYQLEDLGDLNDSVITISDDSATHSYTSFNKCLTDEEAEDKLSEAVAGNHQSTQISSDSLSCSLTTAYKSLSSEEAESKLSEAVAVNYQSAQFSNDSLSCSRTTAYKSLSTEEVYNEAAQISVNSLSYSQSSSYTCPSDKEAKTKLSEAVGINNQTGKDSDVSSSSSSVYKYYSDEVKGTKTQEEHTNSLYDACEDGLESLDLSENKSIDKNSPCQELEDSLEDINRFLTQADDNSSLYSLESSGKGEFNPTKTFTLSPTPDAKKQKTPRKLCNTYSKLKPPSVFSDALLTPDKAKAEFKVPTKLPKKLLTPRSNPSKLNLKDVVSPIRLYINNSPKYCPLIKVKAKESSHLKVGSHESTSVKENIPQPLMSDIPPVIYNPAKRHVLQENKVINLPGNMKKLVNEPIVIKHEYRINMENRSRESVEQKLTDPNWTMNDTVDNVDISVLTSNQAFNV